MDPNVPAPDSIDQAPTGIDPQQLLHYLAAGPMNIARHSSNILNQGDLLPSQMSINPGAEGFNLAAGSMFPGAPAGSLAAGGTGWRGLSQAQREALKSLGNKESISLEEAQHMLDRIGIQHKTELHPRGAKPNRQTSYIRAQDPNATDPLAPIASFRFPADQHLGYPRSNTDFIDTGTEFPKRVGDIDKRTSFMRYPGTIVNQGGQPIAAPENFEQYLKWRFSRAPGDASWLVPEEYAPMRPEAGQPTPSKPSNRGQMSFMSRLVDSLKKE
jgi:hypothetical protein